MGMVGVMWLGPCAWKGLEDKHIQYIVIKRQVMAMKSENSISVDSLETLETCSWMFWTAFMGAFSRGYSAFSIS
jgi:hypothetical protein